MGDRIEERFVVGFTRAHPEHLCLARFGGSREALALAFEDERMHGGRVRVGQLQKLPCFSVPNADQVGADGEVSIVPAERERTDGARALQIVDRLAVG